MSYNLHQLLILQGQVLASHPNHPLEATLLALHFNHFECLCVGQTTVNKTYTQRALAKDQKANSVVMLAFLCSFRHGTAQQQMGTYIVTKSKIKSCN